jgi:hypothetical protein
MPGPPRRISSACVQFRPGCTSGSARSRRISESAQSCLRNWTASADTGDGTQNGLTSDEREGLPPLRREKRHPEIESEIFRPAGRTSRAMMPFPG